MTCSKFKNLPVFQKQGWVEPQINNLLTSFHIA